MKNRHIIGGLIALAPVAVLAQVATTPPSAGNAMETQTQPPVSNSLDATNMAANGSDDSMTTDPATDTNSVDAETTNDPNNSATNTTDDAPPEPKG